MSLQWHYRGNRGRGARNKTPGRADWYGGQHQAEAPAAAWNRPGEGCRLQTAAAAAQAQAAAPQAGPGAQVAAAVDL
eukprot:4071732-Amphidinium_carterae.1